MKALDLVVSENKIFLCFSHCKAMEANDPWGGVILDPSVIIGRIYSKLRITMLHTKYRSFWSCGFREEDFFHVFPIIGIWGIMTPPLDPRQDL